MQLEKEQDRLIEWFANLIKKFRDEYNKLTEAEKSRLYHMDGYNFPCQLEVFWLLNPNWQLIIKTNSTQRPDGEIRVNGPYDSHIFLDEVEKILNEPRWSDTSTKEKYQDSSSRLQNLNAETLAIHLHNFVERAKNSLFIKMPDFRGHVLQETIGTGAVIMLHWGNMADLDYAAFVDKIIQDVKNRAEISKKQAPVESQDSQKVQPVEQPKAYGTYFFPPIIVGHARKPTMRDLLYGGSPYVSPFDNKAFDMKFQEIPLIISKDGYVVVCTEKENALKILNTIMATLMLEGIEAFVVREHELSEVTYRPETLTITGFTYNMKTVRDLLFQERGENEIRLDYRRRELPEHDLRNIIKKASDIYQDTEASEELRIFLEAIAHLKDSEFAQAFFMGWVIIERHISNMWDDKIRERRMDGNRTSKLRNPSMWSIDYLLEVLNFDGSIEDGDYAIFMELKGKRNKLMHSGKQIGKEDAEKCVNVAKRIMMKNILSTIGN